VTDDRTDVESSETGSAVGTRVVGIDLGERRIGVSVSDSQRVLATPHSVITRTDAPSVDRRAIAALVSEFGAGLVVGGLPLTLAGDRGPAALRQRIGSRGGSGLGHAHGRIPLGSRTGLCDDRHGRIVRWRRRVAGRDCRRAALPPLDGGAQLQTFVGCPCHVGEHGMRSGAVETVDLQPSRRPFVGRAGLRRAAPSGHRPAGRIEPHGNGDSSAFQRGRLASVASVAGRRVM